ncbi:hypothetical protein ACHAW6_005904 [Cyclotella cf. meneghiniana]
MDYEVATLQSSGKGLGRDINKKEDQHPVDINREVHERAIPDHAVRQVSEFGLGIFYSQLVEHFYFLFQKQDLAASQEGCTS